MALVTIPEAWPAAGHPFTVDDLDRMPDDGHRYELLDGVLIVSPRPATPQHEVAAELLVALRQACPPSFVWFRRTSSLASLPADVRSVAGRVPRVKS